MLLSPRRCSTLGDLLRLVAVWLAVVLLLQGFAAVHARVAGPAHLHRGPASAALLVHRHQHDEAQRHHHAAGDSSVLPSAEAAALDDALDAAAEALAAAFVLLAFAQALTRVGATAARVWRPATGWPALSTGVDPLLKPPRR